MLFYFHCRNIATVLKIHEENLLFIDIETVAQSISFAQLSKKWQLLWCVKAGHYMPEEETPEHFYTKRAAILAEFGKIICISVGYLNKEQEQLRLRIKSFYGDDEKQVLESFLHSANQWYKIRKHIRFCGHNIKEFDVPYICRRLLINGLVVPTYLNFQDMKPWETNITDTIHLWKFGDFKNYISLNLLAACLGVESPKNDMDGSMVGEMYWKKKDMMRIVKYCQADVVTVAQIIMRLKHLPLLHEDQVEIV